MTINLQRFTTAVPQILQQSALRLAVDNAKELSAYHVEENDPFLPLVRAEIATRLMNDFQLIETPHVENGVSSKGEVIFAFEEIGSQRKLVGFATYKPRLPEFTCASIAHMVVVKNYRGRGILRQMMTEILSHYAIVGLDCRIGLVPIYEKFGFKVTGAQGTHISMATGTLSGVMISIDDNLLMKSPPLLQAKKTISDSLGKNSKAGYSKFNEQNQLAAQEAEAFIASRGL
jgi:GNAT superfamily N-acetyltransferase